MPRGIVVSAMPGDTLNVMKRDSSHDCSGSAVPAPASTETTPDASELFGSLSPLGYETMHVLAKADNPIRHTPANRATSGVPPIRLGLFFTITVSLLS